MPETMCLARTMLFELRLDRPLPTWGSRILVVPLLLACLVATCTAQQPAIELGNPINPAQSAASIAFLGGDCPISSCYAASIQPISDAHHKAVRSYLVFSDKSETAADIRQYLRCFHHSLPALRDPEQMLMKQADAEFTPAAAVFDRLGTLVHRGRDDDLYETFGGTRPEPTTHEFGDALQAALEGRWRSPTHREVSGVASYVWDIE
jgi:hypothetical protein